MKTLSIRQRLLAWIGLLVLLMLTGFGVTAYELTRRTRLAQLDEWLARRVAVLAQEIRGGPMLRGGTGERPPPPGGDRTKRDSREPPGGWDDGGPRGPGAPPDEGRGPPRGPGESATRTGPARTLRLSAAAAALFDEPGPGASYFIVWSTGGSVMGRSTEVPDGVAQPPAGGMQAGIKFLTAGNERRAFYYTERGDCALVGVDLRAFEADLRRFLVTLLGVGLLVLAVGAGGAWWIITRALRPVGAISAAAGRIAATDLSARIDLAEYETELGQLAQTLNTTFARLETAFARQRQFTADASHEVRTPLTVIISEAQAALARPRSEAEYRETLETCLEAAQDLRRLAEQLLELARVDGGTGVDQRETFDVAELADVAAGLVRPLVEARGLRLETDLQPATVLGQRTRLRQVLVNLLDNAIHYNRPGGLVRVETRRKGGECLLVVSDTGVGIAAEDLPRIFDRFYRADRARTATEGHAGLGLAIVHAIVEAHGGRIEVTSRVGEGTRFVVRLPA